MPDNKSLRELVEDNVVIFLLTTLLTGFLAGWTTYRTILAVSGRETIEKDKLERLEQAELDLAGLRSTRLANAGTIDPCKSSGHGDDPGCYLDFGQVWNDIKQFDQAIALFSHSDSALKTINDPEARLEKKAFLYKSWGWASLGRGDCKDAIARFEEAQRIFEHNTFNDDDNAKKGLVSTKDGLSRAQSNCLKAQKFLP